MPKIPGDTDLPEEWVLEVTYKPIRNIWFRVDSRRRKFRISAPEGIHPESLKKAIRAKADWMVSRATRPAPPLLIPERVSDGDTCLVNGIPCPVTLHADSAKNLVAYDPDSGIDIRVKKGGCGSDLVRLVPAVPEAGYPGSHPCLGTPARRPGGGVSHPEDEDPVGELQYPGKADLDQPQPGLPPPGPADLCAGP